MVPLQIHTPRPNLPNAIMKWQRSVACFRSAYGRIVCFRDGMCTRGVTIRNNMKSLSQKTAEINNLLQIRHETFEQTVNWLPRARIL